MGGEFTYQPKWDPIGFEPWPVWRAHEVTRPMAVFRRVLSRRRLQMLPLQQVLRASVANQRGVPTWVSPTWICLQKPAVIDSNHSVHNPSFQKPDLIPLGCCWFSEKEDPTGKDGEVSPRNWFLINVGSLHGVPQDGFASNQR